MSEETKVEHLKRLKQEEQLEQVEQLKQVEQPSEANKLEVLKKQMEKVAEIKKEQLQEVKNLERLKEQLEAMKEQLSKIGKEQLKGESKELEIAKKEIYKLPQKKYFRQRAHSNPLSDHELDYPSNPQEMDWSLHYPNYFNQQQVGQKKQVEVVDIGCGYGGLLINLANILPNTLSLGMEIRVKVSSYVRTRISKLRLQQSQTKAEDKEETTSSSDYQNIACIRANAMKHMPNFFRKGQLRKAFILFPDPHFKKQKLKWRVVSPLLLAEYAYVLATDALLYTITDVLEVHEWMMKCLDEHPSFSRVDENELVDDPCYKAIFVTTEEGMKVARNGGEKYPAVYRRLAD